MQYITDHRRYRKDDLAGIVSSLKPKPEVTIPALDHKSGQGAYVLLQSH
jgi:hypothetical protein